jgi:hypothetical protein
VQQFAAALVLALALAAAPSSAQTSCPTTPPSLDLPTNRVRVCSLADGVDRFEIEILSDAATAPRVVTAPGVASGTTSSPILLGTLAEVCGDGTSRARACDDAVTPADGGPCGAWGSPIPSTFRDCLRAPVLVEP